MEQFSIIITSLRGDVYSVVPVANGESLLDAIEKACVPGAQNKRVTLWDNHSSMSKGVRVIHSTWEGESIQRTLHSNPVGDLIAEKKRIQAIKYLREKHPVLGLKEAKELVDTLVVN